MQAFEEFRNEVVAIIDETISSLYGSISFKKEIEKPPEGMGDIAFPCFSLSRSLKKNPSEIAKEISSAMQKKKKEWISKVECKGGYVNFFVNEQKLAESVIKSIFDEKDKYGSHPSKNKRVIVEHTSANPNGPLHVGRARNPIIGDTLARILKFAGYDVETQFYVDDMGKQVATLFWGVKNLDVETKGIKDDHRLVPFYQEASRLLEKDEKVKEEIEEIIRKCEAGDEKILEEIKEVYEKVLHGMIESLEKLNISIDSFIEESRFVLDGSVKKVIEKLKETEFACMENNAIYLDVEKFGIHGRNKKFFLTRKDGTSLYATRDIAYHIWKGKQADVLVNILGEDHKLEAKLVEIALNLLGEKTPVVVFYSFVSLPEGKMSTRKGRVVYLDDLIEEAIGRAYQEVKKRRDLDEEKVRFISQKVGTGAIRYNIIKVKPEKAIVFTWEDALNFEGQSAPFIQYAHARCCSILKKAEVKMQSFSYEHVQEKALIKILAMFPEIVKECAETFNPSLLAEYAYSLASSFNAFYRDCRVLGSKKEKERLALVYATKCTIKNALNLLGIEALEEM